MHQSVVENKYDALKTRFLDQVELLYRLSMVDLRVFSGYITLQLVIGGWVAVNKEAIDPIFLKIGFIVIDVGLAIVATAFLYNNRQRRKEVIQTVKNCNEALGYEDEGAYLPNKKLNAPTTTRTWTLWYIVALFLALLGVAVITFARVETKIICP